MSRTTWAAFMSAGPAVGEGEVVLPAGAVVGDLPGAADGVPVVAEGAGEALPEVQGREVGRLPRERPHPIGEAHRVQARHAAGVVVMLRVRAGPRVDADDRQAVGRFGYRDLGALQQELSIQSPFEPAARPRPFPGRASEAGLYDPFTDEDVEPRQRLRSVLGHDDHSRSHSRSRVSLTATTTTTERTHRTLRPTPPR